MNYDDVLSLTSAKERKAGYEARCKCPAHNGTSDDSLSIKKSDQDGISAILYCHSGCTYQEIAAALGNPLPPPTNGHKPRKKKKINYKEVAHYDYTDEAGNLLFQKVRLEPKSFRVKTPSTNGGGWNYSIGDARRVLYHLPELLTADTIYIVEGEKDVDRLRQEGLIATTNFDGASKGKQSPKWLPEYNPIFKNKTVYIIPDHDEPGDAHASNIKRQLQDFAKEVRIIDLPGIGAAGDVSDWLNMGNTVDELVKITSEPTTGGVWSFKSIADAQEELEPIEYIVNKVIAKPSVNIFFGAPGTMKSMLLGDMCMSILGGENWLESPEGVGGLETSFCPIIWIDVDNGDRRSRERFGALSRARNIKGEYNPPFYWLSMPKPAIIAGNINTMLDLKSAIAETGAGLIVFDNLGRITGDVEENSAGMGNVMASLRDIAEDTGCAIIVIHHQRKSNGGAGRAGDSLRGHSSIEASLDLAIHVAREPNSPRITIMSTKTRGVDVPMMVAEFSYEHHLNTNDLKEARFFGVPGVVGINPDREAILYILKTQGAMNAKMLIERVQDYTERNGKKRPGVNKLRDYIKDMVEERGTIKAEKGDRTEVIYSAV